MRMLAVTIAAMAGSVAAHATDAVTFPERNEARLKEWRFPTLPTCGR